MGPELIEKDHVELFDDAQHVVSAWLLAVVVVTLLMTVIAPFLSA